MKPINQDQLAEALGTTRFLILDFFSPGCAPCKATEPIIAEVVREAQAEGVSIDAFGIDITVDPSLAQNHFVLGVPTIILFRDGQEIHRLNSVPKKDKILSLLK